jgi:hypothetical protein
LQIERDAAARIDREEGRQDLRWTGPSRGRSSRGRGRRSG